MDAYIKTKIKIKEYDVLKKKILFTLKIIHKLPMKKNKWIKRVVWKFVYT